MSHDRTFRFGVQCSTASSAAEWRDRARKMEDLGYSTLFAPDHFIGAPLAPMVAVAMAAEATTTLRVGHLVLGNDYKHPAIVAKEAATIDLLSDGRMELGIGAGWHRREYEAYGYPFPPMVERLAQLREAIGVVKRLWTGEPVDHDGPRYRLRAARCTPVPAQKPRPPILVGGGGPGLLAIAAAEADVVNVVPPASHGAADPAAVRGFTLERFQAKAAAVRRLAAEAGRDPATVVLSAIFFVRVTDDAASTRQVHEAVAARYGLSLPEAERFPLMLAGTPDALRERLAERIAALDVGYVVLNFAAPEAITRFAAEVLPAFRRA